jgi:predicted PurR-regulated permease PerM
MSGRNEHQNSFATLASLSLIVAMLYWGQPVLMPLAMALLLAFVLAPAVKILCRWRLPHVLAVTIVVTHAVALLGGGLFIIGRQFDSLARELPRYEDNIREKIHDLRQTFKSESLKRTRETLRQLSGELNSTEETNAPSTNNPTAKNSPTNAKANPKVTAPPAPPSADAPEATALLSSSMPKVLTRLLGPLSSVVGTGALVIVLVIFMLLRQEGQWNRLIRLGGIQQKERTKRILTEVGARISRYLLTYSLLNTIYGVAVAIGLAIIGLPYAIMWGFFAGMVRFIPYVGPWLGAVLPVMLSLAVFPGWMHPLYIAVFYATIELITNMVLEPIFYGRSAGVPEVGLIVALAFWTWIWGPVGLLLGTPLTVCLVVLAKHIPALEPLHVLIGEEPNDEPHAAARRSSTTG